jgi:pimeloyl-ACP methyl ester carboxylesterase
MSDLLANACPGEVRYLSGPFGHLALYSSGVPGTTPLVLIHSVNAAASAYEVRPLYEDFARSRPVLAPDLPGFGLSERGDRDYSIRMMTDAVHAAVEAARAAHGGAPVDALAVSLGCEFLARAAVERPEAYRRLALVSPTGFQRKAPTDGPVGGHRGVGWLRRMVAPAAVGETIFRNLTRPGVIRYFLRRTFGRDAIDEGLWVYDCATVRAPGARFAPLAFVSGFLFSTDAPALYRRLAQPVWMCHGVRGDFTDYGRKVDFADRSNWRFTEYDSGAMPYFELREPFLRDCRAFFDADA